MASLRNSLINGVLSLTRFKDGMARDIQRGADRSARPPAGLARRMRCEIIRGREVWFIPPKGKAPDADAPLIFALHGGAFFYGIMPLLFRGYARLADAARCTVILPDYPLCPDANVDEITAFTFSLFDDLAQRFGASRLRLIGDSAGGNLALALLQSRLAHAKALPLRAVLWSPWLDLTLQDEAVLSQNLRSVTIGLEGLRSAAELYAGARAATDPLVSPLFGELHGLPPLLIETGRRDLLCPDSLRLAKALTNAGVEVTLCAHAELDHYWMFLPQPEAGPSYRRAAAFLRALP